MPSNAPEFGLRGLRNLSVLPQKAFLAFLLCASVSLWLIRLPGAVYAY